MAGGKGGGTTETTQSTNYAPWISQAQQAALGASLGQNLPFLQNSQYGHAGFNPDQQKAFDLARDMVGQYGPGSNDRSGAAGYVKNAIGMAGQGGRSEAAQLGGNDFQEFMNPFLETALVPATDELQRQTENARAGQGARMAAASAYGGSRGMLGDAQLDRSMQETGSRLVADTMAAGFDKANALAEGNVNRQQQTNLANASNALQGAGLTMQGAGLLENLLNGEFDRNRTVMGDLMGVGQFQQQDMQDILNMPYEALARLYGFIPQVYDTQQVGTQPDNTASPFQQLLGLGLSIGGMPTAGGGSLLGGWLS